MYVFVSVVFFILRISPAWGLLLVPFIYITEAQSSVFLLETSLGVPLLALRL